MDKKRAFMRKTYIRSWKLIHFFLTIAMFTICWLSSYNHIRLFEQKSIQPWVIVILYGLSTAFLLRTYNAYRISLSRVKTLLYSQCLSQVLSAGLIYILLCVNEFGMVNPGAMIVLLVAQLAVNLVWSMLARKLYFRLNPVKKTALIYRNQEDLKRLQEVYRFEKKFKVTKVLSASFGQKELIEELKGCEAVFLAMEEGDLRSNIIAWCVEENVDAYIAPSVGDILMTGAAHMEMFSSPVMRIIRHRAKAECLLAKRMVDITCSLLGIVLLWPVMAITAIAVKLYDGGPSFYTQVRLTQDGKEFRILKFRSMRVDAEEDGVPRLASDGDVRITPVGKVIRTFHIDELPQLLNILYGDMSIVGPRPERPEKAVQYEETLPEFRLRLQVKAGLTGFAQVYGKYNTSPYEKLQMDLMYINNMSLLEDLKLMLATVKILFIKEPSSGVDGEQAMVQEDVESFAGSL